MKLLYLLPFVALVSCAYRQVGPANPGVRTSGIEQRGGREIPVELGASEFHDGDSVTIAHVRGTEPAFAVGSSYVVRGHYRLMSRDRATLLLSITAMGTAGNIPIEEGSRLDVQRGEGDFVLWSQINYAGYPHLTFYGSDGYPIGGVYFGNGRSLLQNKSWSYRP